MSYWVNENSASEFLESSCVTDAQPVAKTRGLTTWRILDVGSGANPKGDVNCDLYIGRKKHAFYKVRKAKNFIRCDAHHLPFRDNAFNIVHSSHLLEHLKHPAQALEEMKRVTKKTVYLQVPDSSKHPIQISYHIYGWDFGTFTNLLKTIFPEVEIYSTNKGVVHGRILNRLWLLQQLIYFLLRHLLPNELTAICLK